jgi:polyphosphate kinase 2 (PPK2 family)
LIETMLVRPDIFLVKDWFSVSDDEHERRFAERMRNPIKRWKLSPMDLESRKRWVEYSRAKDEMFKLTDLQDTPWWVVDADDKRRARLNCLKHFLSCVPYEDMTPQPVALPSRQQDDTYVRPPMGAQRFVTAHV